MFVAYPEGNAGIAIYTFSRLRKLHLKVVSFQIGGMLNMVGFGVNLKDKDIISMCFTEPWFKFKIL